jgi:hypothetical protein
MAKNAGVLRVVALINVKLRAGAHVTKFPKDRWAVVALLTLATLKANAVPS